MPHAIGIDLGGTEIKGVRIAPDGRVVQDYANVSGKVWAFALREAVSNLELRDGPVPTIGVAAPGLAARDGRSIAFMPGRLPGLEGLDMQRHLGRKHAVPVLNDAQAALLGEVWTGAGRGATNAILLTLGTGVGGAILADGRLLRGHIGRAGHLGHLTVNADGPPDIVNTPGSLEDAIGNSTIAARTNGAFQSTRDLVAAAAHGNLDAARVWDRSVHALACGIVSLINIVDPEVVIIGGGISNAGPMLFDPLAKHLDAMEWRPGGARVRIVPAQLGPIAGAIGAARAGMLASPSL
jgi:glucokinase